MHLPAGHPRGHLGRCGTWRVPPSQSGLRHHPRFDDRKRTGSVRSLEVVPQAPRAFIALARLLLGARTMRVPGHPCRWGSAPRPDDRSVICPRRGLSRGHFRTNKGQTPLSCVLISPLSNPRRSLKSLAQIGELTPGAFSALDTSRCGSTGRTGRRPRTPAPVRSRRSGAPLWFPPASGGRTRPPPARRKPSGSPTSGSWSTRSKTTSVSGASMASSASRTMRRPEPSPAASFTRRVGGFVAFPQGSIAPQARAGSDPEPRNQVLA